MGIYRFLIRKSARSAGFALLAGILSGLSSAALIALINKALRNDATAGGLIWSFAALCAATLIARVSSGILSIRFAQKVVFDLRMELSRRVLKAPLARLEEVGIHRLQSALIEDVSVISSTIVSIPVHCINVAIVAFCVVYMGWISWVALLLVVVFAVLGILIYRFATRRVTRFLKLVREGQDTLFRHFRALIEGGKELRLHQGRRAAFIRDLHDTTTFYKSHSVKSAFIFSAFGSWTHLLYFTLIGVMLFLAPALQNTEPQKLIGCVLIFLYMRGPLEGILGIIPSLNSASIALKKIESLGVSLSTKSPDDSAGARAHKNGFNKLELIDVKHAYKGEEQGQSFVLGPVSTTLRPGEIVFLIGGNGSGKTTFIKLLSGLHAPESGEIRLDDAVITAERMDDYRQLFSVVFYDFFLFDSLLGLDGADPDAKAKEYLVKLQLDHKVRITDGNLSTTELSLGQRKRLALLTAYLEDRPIYIFDEWAADQDPAFKGVFYNELLPELKARGKAVLVISHDDHYYHAADRIIKLEGGKVEYDRQTDETLLALFARDSFSAAG
jgi:putative ATP-binding cassette transporter